MLEPGRTTPCQECGAELSVSWKGMLISFAFLVIALIVISSITVLQWIKIVAVAAAIIIYLFLDFKFSPLMKKEPKVKKAEEKPAE
jgi:hypothetical protein